MNDLKNNTLLFFILGFLFGTGITLLASEYFGVGGILMISVVGTLLSLFWNDLIKIFK